MTTEILRLKLPVPLARALDAMAAMSVPNASLRYGRNGYLIVEVEDPQLTSADD